MSRLEHLQEKKQQDSLADFIVEDNSQSAKYSPTEQRIIDEVELEEASYTISAEEVQDIKDEISQYKNFRDWFQETVKPIFHGDATDMVKKILCSLATFQGRNSQFILTESRPGIGKSYSDSILIDYVFPEEFVFRANELTKAALADLGSEQLNKKLVFIGDVGDKSKIYRDNSEYEIFKHLVTENSFKRIKQSQDDKEWANIEQEVVVDAISVMMESVTVNQSDVQYESRTESFIVPEPEVSPQRYEYRDRLRKLKNKKYGLGNADQTMDKLEKLSKFIGYLVQEYQGSCPDAFWEYLMDYYEFNQIKNDVDRKFERIIDQYDSWCQLNDFDTEDRNNIEEFMDLFYPQSPDIGPAEQEIFDLLTRRFDVVDWDDCVPGKAYRFEDVLSKDGGSAELYSNFGYEGKPRLFFTEGNIRSREHSSKAVKGLGETQVKTVLYSLYLKGYLGMLPEQRVYAHKTQNIYYLK